MGSSQTASGELLMITASDQAEQTLTDSSKAKGDVSVNSEDNVSKTSDPAPEVSEATTDDPLNFNPLPSGAPPPCPGPERVSGTSRFRRWKERNSTPDSKAPDPTTGVPKP